VPLAFLLLGGFVHVPADGPTTLTPAAWVTSVNQDVEAGPTILNLPADAEKWLTVDVGVIGVPLDATAVHLSGRLQMTAGAASETCDMHLFLRRPGTPDDALASIHYIGQVANSLHSGQRSGVGAWVALTAGQFELRWTRTTPPPWPEHCSYSIRLYADAWVRPVP
jgi:hypothetical protein